MEMPHSLLLSAMGTLRSESVVQQGDPLGPLLFCLVLHKVVTAIAAESLSQLSFHSWYVDDRVIAGPKQTVLQTLSIIFKKQLGPPLGVFINTSKCECSVKGTDLGGFPNEMKKSNTLNLGVILFFSKSIAEKRANATKFLPKLTDIGSVDSQFAFSLLHQFGELCKMVYNARCTFCCTGRFALI